MNRLKDIPELARDGKNLSAVMQAVRETIQTFRGYRGDPLDVALTLRDAVSRGLVLQAPGTSGAGGLIGSGNSSWPGGSADSEIDPTPPPTPDWLTVSAGITSLFVECAPPFYTQGHGHAVTVVYGAKWPTGGTVPVFTDAVELFQFQGTFSAYTSDPATRWCIWIKWKSVDGYLSVNPQGGTNGQQATTGQNVAALLEALSQQITISELHSTLATPIGLIDAPGTGLVTAMAQAQASISAINSMLADIASTPEYDAGTTYAVDAIVKYGGALYQALSATTGNLPTNATYWKKIGDYASIGDAVAGHAAILADHETRITNTANGLTGEASERTSLQTQVRGSYTGTDIASLSSGLLYNERQARSSADASEVAARQLLSATLVGSNDPTGKTLANITSGLVFEEKSARVTAVDAVATRTSLLEASVNNGSTGLATKASVMQVATAKAEAIAASASVTDSISARLNSGGDILTAINTTTSTASTKNANFVQGAAPTATRQDDLWIDTANGNLLMRWNGSAWVPAEDQRIGATATQVTTLQSRVGNGGNQIDNSEFASDLTGWIVSAGVTFNRGTPSGGAAKGYAYMQEHGGNADPNYYFEAMPANTPVVSGKRYQASVYVTGHRCKVSVFIYWRNSSGSIIGNSPVIESNNSWDDFNTLFGYTRIASFGIAPSGAAMAQVVVRKTTTIQGFGYSDSYAFFTRVMFCGATDTQTLPDEYSPGTAVSSLQIEATTRASQTGDLYAQYTVKTDVAGLVSGYGLASTSNNAAPTSAFGVRANQFFISPPSVAQSTAPTANLYDGYCWLDTSVSPAVTRYRSGASWTTTAPILPFVVQTTPTTINGQPVPAGVYANALFVMNGTITNLMVGKLQLDDGHVANLSVAKLLAGSMQVGSYIQSTSYVPGSAGWHINANGNAEFSGVVVRGTVYATAGQIGGNTIDASGMQSPGYSPGVSGWRLGSDGSLNAMSGSFKGSISGATGTFTGSITGASGTFGGNVSGGQFTTGAFTGYGWPASGGSGSYLGPSGLRLGNFNDGKYFDVTAAGNIYAPGFSVVNGTLTINQANVINTLNLAGNAVTTPVSAYTAASMAILSGAAQSLSITTTGQQVFIIGTVMVETSTASAAVQLRRNGNPLMTAQMLASSKYLNTLQISDTPPAGTHTYELFINGSGACTIDSRSLFALETKR